MKEKYLNLKVKLLNKIYLGTNDIGLKKLSLKYKIHFVKREEKYCDEKKTNATEMVKNMLKYVDADIILWAHATNPFIDHLIYNKAIKSFKKSTKNFDSLFSVSSLKIIFGTTKKNLLTTTHSQKNTL